MALSPTPTKATPKAEDKSEATTATGAPEAEATNLSEPTGGTRFIALARLRRETMILDSSKDPEYIDALAAEAVRKGRASEVFVIEAKGYFSESEIDFTVEPAKVNPLYADQNAARVPLLNPSTGEQALDVAAASDPNPPTAPTPTQGASGQGDSNNGAGVGTGNTAPTADQVNDRDA